MGVCGSSEPDPEWISQDVEGCEESKEQYDSYTDETNPGKTPGNYIESTYNGMESATIEIPGSWKDSKIDTNLSMVVTKIIQFMTDATGEMIVRSEYESGECTICIKADNVTCDMSENSGKYQNQFATKIDELFESFFTDPAFWTMTCTQKDCMTENRKANARHAILQEADEYTSSDESSVDVDSQVFHILNDNEEQTMLQ
eukprot:867343_1